MNDPKQHVRSAVSNGTRLLDGVDGRSTTARRFRDLIAELTTEAGGDSALLASDRAAIRQVAAIQLRAEQLQGAIVRGEEIDSDLLIRLSGEARRLLARLPKASRGKLGDLPGGSGFAQDAKA